MRLFSKKTKTNIAGINISGSSSNRITLRSEETRICTEKSLAEFRSAGVKKYKISDCGDSRVCPVCKKLNGKVYDVMDAVIGKNAPPFCDECRCVILPVWK